MRYWVRDLFSCGLIVVTLSGTAFAQSEPEFIIEMPTALIDVDDDNVREISNSFINVYRALKNASFGTEMPVEPYNFVFTAKKGLLADGTVDVSHLSYLSAELIEKAVLTIPHNKDCMISKNLIKNQNEKDPVPLIIVLADSSSGQHENLACFMIGLSFAAGTNSQQDGTVVENSQDWDERAYEIFSAISERNHNTISQGTNK